MLRSSLSKHGLQAVSKLMKEEDRWDERNSNQRSVCILRGLLCLRSRRPSSHDHRTNCRQTFAGTADEACRVPGKPRSAPSVPPFPPCGTCPRGYEISHFPSLAIKVKVIHPTPSKTIVVAKGRYGVFTEASQGRLSFQLAWSSSSRGSIPCKLSTSGH